MGKLVRDCIPEIMKAEGGNPTVLQLDQPTFKIAILAKLEEEVIELVDVAAYSYPTDRELLLEEIGDVLEVLMEIANTFEFSWDDVTRTADRKYELKGGFNAGFWLDCE